MQLDGFMTRLQTEYFVFQCGSSVRSTVYFLFALFAYQESMRSELACCRYSRLLVLCVELLLTVFILLLGLKLCKVVRPLCEPDHTPFPIFRTFFS